LILLGLGKNGHTASLFPQAEILKDQTGEVVWRADKAATAQLDLR